MFSPADVEAYEEGSVGWATARLTITMPDGRWGLTQMERGLPP